MGIHRSLGVATLVALMATHRETMPNSAAGDPLGMLDTVERLERESTDRNAPAREPREPSMG